MLKLLLLAVSFNVLSAQNTTTSKDSIYNQILNNKAALINNQQQSTNPISHLKKIGAGKMHYLFWHLYNAEFYAKNNAFQKNTYPQALKLTYKRNIKKTDFIDATKDQWDKLRKKDGNINVPDELQALWINKLNNIFTNIQTNDTILLVINENKESIFFLQKGNNKKGAYTAKHQNIGIIKNTDFGPYFLSIWLSEFTSEPKLRKKLIGEST